MLKKKIKDRTLNAKSDIAVSPLRPSPAGICGDANRLFKSLCIWKNIVFGGTTETVEGSYSELVHEEKEFKDILGKSNLDMVKRW